MKIFANKIFLSILLGIFLLFSVQFYFILFSYQRDTNSYVTLLKWAWVLTSANHTTSLTLNSKEKVISGDILEVQNDGLAVIEWWDKSVTRLAGNTKIEIKENFVSEDLTKVGISFELLKWKTWSNVVSMLWEDSYFKQDVKNVTASVRGTVFEANYENDTIWVHNHQVLITDTQGKQKTLSTGQELKISLFSIQRIQEALQDGWSELNQEMDIEYYKKLSQAFIQEFSQTWVIAQVKNYIPNDAQSSQKIIQMLLSWESNEAIQTYLNTLPEEQKKEALHQLESFHQLTNFENGTNTYVYELKLKTRDLLMENTQDEALKKLIVKYSLYDLETLLSNSGGIQSQIAQDTLWFLTQHKSYISLQEIGIQNLKSSVEILRWVLEKTQMKDTFDVIQEHVGKLNETGKGLIENGIKNVLQWIPLPQ